MVKIKKRKKADPFADFVENHPAVSLKDREGSLNFLVAFVNLIRPRSERPGEVEQKFADTLQMLQQHPAVLNDLKVAIIAQLINSNLIPLLTESGVAISRGAGRELYARLKHKFLPYLQDQHDFLYLLNRIFYRSTDYEWVERIGHARWTQFFEMTGLAFSGNEQVIVRQSLTALQILSAGVAQLGWEQEVVNHAPFKIMQAPNPFSEQQRLIYVLQEAIQAQAPVEKIRQLSIEVKATISEGLEVVQYIRRQTAEKGASLSQTFILVQIEQKLQRMLLVLDIVDADEHLDTSRLSALFITVIRNENRKNSLREFLSQTTGYIAYQIAEHKTRKGNKYITSSPLEYFQMIGSAMWGGLIVCFVAILKVLLGMLHYVAPFWQGFLYSVNYSLGFIAIEETKATLATKQPAFTASAVAGSLDTRKADDSPNLYNLAVTVSKVSRSQIASFIGNLIVVFPVTYLLAWLFHLSFGVPLADAEKGRQMLNDQHPGHSLSLLYACNTGVFLFLSSIIAGWVQNKVNFGRIGRRLREHPVLRVYIAPKRLERLSHYLEDHAGSLMGNIALGFFLGMASTAGKLFGIPFDIRHITISAANTSIGLYGVGWNNVSYSYLATVVGGVLGIGFLNFLVSFSLAFIVAVRSRGIHLRDYPEFIGILWKYFRSHPLDFFRPRKRLTP